VVGATVEGSPTKDGVFTLVPPLRPETLNGTLFYLTLPGRLARELRRFRPEAILTQSPYEAAAVLLGRKLAHSDAKLVVDVHGDWRTLSRLYGSRLRALLRPFSDRIAVAALRRADAVRTVSGFTTTLARQVGVEPSGTFPAFMDLEPFLGPVQALPERPQALFVGVLELYKNVDGLAEAWRLAAPAVPGARLRLVGSGTRTDVGGVTEILRDGENGLLVPMNDPEALAGAIRRYFDDEALQERLRAATVASVARFSPDEIYGRLEALLEEVASAHAS